MLRVGRVFSGATVCAALLVKQQTQGLTWGSSEFGQLGLGDDKAHNVPQSASESGIVKVRLGGDTSLFLGAAGELYSFGRGQDGALGHGDASNEAYPRLVEGLAAVVDASTSGLHSGAVSIDGDLFTWGRSWQGQLGRFAKGKDALVPGKVEFSALAKQVACGRNHTLVLDQQGHVWSFGEGSDGALGLGDKKTRQTPELIAGLDNVVKVAAGDGFSLALTADGTVFTFGNDDYGKLGHGRGNRYQTTPKPIRALKGIRIVDLSAGEFHAGAVSDDGKVYTWGLGKDGQTGHAETSDVTIPRLVSALADNIKAATIACGGGHSAIITDQGEVYAWGRGRSGQLGRGDQLESVAAYRTEPVRVEFFSKNHKALDISLGRNHSAAVFSTA